MKTLSRLTVARDGDTVLVDAAAPSFLHHQVRNIVGTLLLVGLGKWTADYTRLRFKAKKSEATMQ